MGSLIRRPSAFIPIAMSIAAITLLVSYIALFGTERQADEGTAAHLWQLLMAGQVPIIAVFAIKWLPETPRHALPIIALQVAAGVLAAFPVWYFQW